MTCDRKRPALTEFVFNDEAHVDIWVGRTHVSLLVVASGKSIVPTIRETKGRYRGFYVLMLK